MLVNVLWSLSFLSFCLFEHPKLWLSHFVGFGEGSTDGHWSWLQPGSGGGAGGTGHVTGGSAWLDQDLPGGQTRGHWYGVNIDFMTGQRLVEQ
jgi:hypothetical protein